LSEEIILKAENISKSFPGVKALDDVCIELRAGEVHGLCGENGAGKSTLLKVITGIYAKDSGAIFIDGKKVEINNTADARSNGVHVVPQEMLMARYLTVAENIFMGRYPMKKVGIVDWERMYSWAKELQSKLGSTAESLDVREKVENLSMGHKQLIEIMRGMVDDDIRVIAFDEPTSSLSNDETEHLFKLIEDFRDRDVSIVYVSHKLNEIFRICDKVTVLKDGQFVDTRNVSEVTDDDIVKMMVGRNLDLFGEKRDKASSLGDVALSVKNFSRHRRYQDITFDAHYGEILGFYGLVGAGRTEVMRGIFAMDARDSGIISINGKKLRINTPKAATKAGIGFITEDRRSEGLMLRASIIMNLSMPNLTAILNKFRLISRKKETVYAIDGIEQFNIRTPSETTVVGNLSGGNQQKVIIAKWVKADCSIIIFDEPTRGIDVGAKAEVYAAIKRLADQGKCIIIVSSELPETMSICDRIIVMRDGMITANLDNENLTEEIIVQHAVKN